MRPHSIRGLLGIVAVLVATLAVALAFGVSTLSPTAQAQAQEIDYDTDDDGLIEINNLEQLDAIRYDLDGDGDVFGNDGDAYKGPDGAFPNGITDTGGNAHMGCPATGCNGYELNTSLDFNDDSSYADATANKGIWTTGAGWTPIGDDSDGLAATFDGNGYTISNLFINVVVDGDAEVGLFGRLAASTVVKNLNLTDIEVTVTNVAEPTPDSGILEVGGLAASSTGAVESSYVSGEISVTNTQRFAYVGGLLGRTSGTTTASGAAVMVNVETLNRALAGGLIGRADSDVNGPIVRDNYATGDVMVSADNFVAAGGLVGAGYGPIMGSYATGNATIMAGGDSSFAEAGGLVGLALGDIVASYATGNATVIASDAGRQVYAGGLVAVTDSNIVASYATGDAIAINHGDGSGTAAGLAGDVTPEFTRTPDATITITASYSTGSARATKTGTNVGGLVGSASTTTAPHSYWDVDSSGQDASAVGTGRTTVALQDPTSRSADNIYAGWNVDVDNADGDFDVTTGVDDPWQFGESWQYPVLKYGILDPAKQRAQVTLVLSEASIDEAGGETTVTVTQDRTSNLPTEVTVSVPAGSPVTLSENRKLVIPAGETESTGTVKIRGVDDGDTTDDETVVVSGQVSAGGSGADNPDAVDLTVLDSMRVTNVRVRPKTTLAVVSWDALEGADGYRVQWKYGGRDWSEDRQQEVSSTATTLRRLRPGTEYTVRVSAANAGAWSAPVTVSTEDPDDEEGLSPFATMTPTPTPTPAVPPATPIPPTAMIATSTATTLMSADGHVTLEFPAGSRSDPYQVNFESEDGCTYAGAKADVTFTCVTVLIFDSEDMLEMGVELEAPATLTFHLTAEQVEALGGEFLLAKLHEMGGLMVLTRGSADDEWTSVPATLAIDDETGVATLTASVSTFSSYTAVAVQATFDAVQEMYGHLLPRDTLTPPTGGPSLPGVALLALLLGSVALLTAGWIMTARRSGGA